MAGSAPSLKRSAGAPTGVRARRWRMFGRDEIEGFLSWLASERQVSPNTHKQALSALLFLYQQVLGQQLPWLSELGRPKRQVRLPVVLTHDEVSRLLRALETDEQRLFGRLLYGTGLRLMEGLLHERPAPLA